MNRIRLKLSIFFLFFFVFLIPVPVSSATLPFQANLDTCSVGITGSCEGMTSIHRCGFAWTPQLEVVSDLSVSGLNSVVVPCSHSDIYFPQFSNTEFDVPLSMSFYILVPSIEKSFTGIRIFPGAIWLPIHGTDIVYGEWHKIELQSRMSISGQPQFRMISSFHSTEWHYFNSYPSEGYHTPFLQFFGWNGMRVYLDNFYYGSTLPEVVPVIPIENQSAITNVFRVYNEQTSTTTWNIGHRVFGRNPEGYGYFGALLSRGPIGAETKRVGIKREVFPLLSFHYCPLGQTEFFNGVVYQPCQPSGELMTGNFYTPWIRWNNLIDLSITDDWVASYFFCEDINCSTGVFRPRGVQIRFPDTIPILTETQAEADFLSPPDDIGISSILHQLGIPQAIRDFFNNIRNQLFQRFPFSWIIPISVIINDISNIPDTDPVFPSMVIAYAGHQIDMFPMERIATGSIFGFSFVPLIAVFRTLLTGIIFILFLMYIVNRSSSFIRALGTTKD
jgi:hypothetical protein